MRAKKQTPWQPGDVTPSDTQAQEAPPAPPPPPVSVTNSQMRAWIGAVNDSLLGVTAAIESQAELVRTRSAANGENRLRARGLVQLLELQARVQSARDEMVSELVKAESDPIAA